MGPQYIPRGKRLKKILRACKAAPRCSSKDEILDQLSGIFSKVDDHAHLYHLKHQAILQLTVEQRDPMKVTLSMVRSHDYKNVSYTKYYGHLLLVSTTGAIAIYVFEEAKTCQNVRMCESKKQIFSKADANGKKIFEADF